MLNRRPFAVLTLSLVLAVSAICQLTAGSDDNLARVSSYLQLNGSQLGLTSADVAGLDLVDEHTTELSGVTNLYFQQRLDGIPVFNGIVNVSTDRDGNIVSVGNRAATGLADRINTNLALISPADAARSAARHLELKVKGGFEVSADLGGPDRHVSLKSSGISRNDIPARLAYFAGNGEEVRLVWLLDIYTMDQSHYWQVLVDAVTAAVLDKVDLVANDSYRVFAPPVAHPGVGSRTLESNPADIIFSPYGWHDTNGVSGAEYTDTRGNNTFTQTNAGFRPSGGVGLNFDFPLDLTVNPNTQGSPTVAQLFYINNFLHDVHARYGFDEASGNFQEFNYSGLGSGSDSVTANANLTVLNNATMLTLPDGSNPTMNMYIWNGSGGLRNTVFDSLIPIHEFGHGVSNRLTGGASNTSCLTQSQARSMGEGWSDWWGLVFTALPGDISTDARAAGVWVTNSAAGIRVYPYSAEMATNPLTYGSITSGLSVPHGVGTVWATTLWDVYWSLVDAYGFDSNFYSGTGGNNIALQLIMDGLKLQPCNPSFLDARDAILQADVNNYGGANQCLLWEAFARRGMGYAAYDGGTSNTLAVTEDFTVPPICNADAYIEDTPYDWGGLPDQGHETEPNMVGAAMWKSRHIWVRHNNDGIYSHQNPEYGQTNYVYARLKNSGPNVSPPHVVSGRVSFWYANASTGLTWPTNWTKFAQIPVANLAAYASRDVVAPFNPPGSGHYCLTAIFESTQDPLAVPLGTNIDVNTRNNNNEAWRNCNIVDLLPNFTSVVWGTVRNIFHLKSVIGLRLRLTDRLTAGPLNEYVETRVVLNDRLFDAWRQAGGRLEGMVLEGNNTFLVTDFTRASLDGIAMDADQEDDIKMTFDLRNKLPHAFHLDLVQLQDGKEVGGIAYQIQEGKQTTNDTPK